MDEHNVNYSKAQREILDILAQSEEDVKNGRVGPALETYDRLRKELLETLNKGEEDFKQGGFYQAREGFDNCKKELFKDGKNIQDVK